MTPKFHLNHCLAKQFFKLKMIFDAFICERLHLRVKKIAEHTDNPRRFERTVLLRSLSAQIGAKNSGVELKSGLRGPITTSGVLAGVSVARRVDCAGNWTCVNDVIRGMSSNAVGVVKCCARDDNTEELFVIVSVLEHLAAISTRANQYRPTDRKIVIAANDVLTARCWYDRVANRGRACVPKCTVVPTALE